MKSRRILIDITQNVKSCTIRVTVIRADGVVEQTHNVRSNTARIAQDDQSAPRRLVEAVEGALWFSEPGLPF